MDTPAGPLILSSWFQYLVSVVLGTMAAAIAYLFQHKADRTELATLREDMKDHVGYLRTDIAEVRGILLGRSVTKHADPED